MCGIIITKSQDKIQSLKHRGIESSFVKEFGFYIGHHRLPIQTVKGDKYKQPIRLNDGGLLLYNGEIFNYPDKYDSDVAYLIDLFNSETPSNVVAYSNNWDGFWAIVYIDTDGFMLCFTDPLGKKQLYYNERGEICSEISPIVRDFKAFDPFFKSSVYKWGYNTTHHTPWKGVKRIMPNCPYIFCSGELLNISRDQYPYNWNSNPPTKSLKELMYESVKSRLISKTYKIGVLISGGLDSSIIAKILEDLGADVTYYTVENDETKYAKMLAEYLQVELNYLDYDIEENPKEIFRWNETPIDLGSVIPQHNLFSIIPEKIVISGDGADELFGGYRRINTYDSQQSDIFEELPFYHLPRLDRASMRYTIELRSPFLSHNIVKYALNLPYKERVNKKHLKDVFRGDLPDEIIDRKKIALKNKHLRSNPDEYKKWVFNMFYNKIY